MGYTGDPFFRSTLDAPDLIPHEHFFPRDLYGVQTDLFGCRHGRVLFFHRTLHEVVVWDPATRDRRCVAVPPEFDDKERIVFNGAVLCTAGGDDGGHVHGDCHSNPFQVVLIGIHEDCTRAFASVYSSESGTWGDLISTAAIRHMYDMTNPSTHTGDSLYWLFDDYEDGILKFDLDRQSLANIEMPDLRCYSYSSSSRIMPAEDGGIGLAILSRYDFQMWERKVTCDGVARWVLQKTIKLNTVLGLGPMGGGDNLILGYDEDDHVIYIRTEIGVCMVQPVSMQFRNLGKDNFTTTAYHPYKSFYTAEMENNLPVNIREYQELAKKALPKMHYDYINGGAEDEHTLRENIAAYGRILLRPRVLIDVSHIDMSTSLLGYHMPSPIIVAPTGSHK